MWSKLCAIVQTTGWDSRDRLTGWDSRDRLTCWDSRDRYKNKSLETTRAGFIHHFQGEGFHCGRTNRDLIIMICGMICLLDATAIGIKLVEIAMRELITDNNKPIDLLVCRVSSL
jgi:hypothetical protein